MDFEYADNLPGARTGKRMYLRIISFRRYIFVKILHNSIDKEVHVHNIFYFTPCYETYISFKFEGNLTICLDADRG